QVLLAQQAVLPKRETMIGGVDDNRFVEQSILPKRFDDIADGSIEMTYHSVIVSDVLPDRLRCPRERFQKFVAHSHFAIVERVDRQIIPRQFDLLGWYAPLRRRRAWIVRRGIGDIQTEWAPGVPRFEKRLG